MFPCMETNCHKFKEKTFYGLLYVLDVLEITVDMRLFLRSLSNSNGLQLYKTDTLKVFAFSIEIGKQVEKRSTNSS